MKKTTRGLAELLIRHGVTPTYELKKDIEMAREFMPKPYNWSKDKQVKIYTPDQARPIKAKQKKDAEAKTADLVVEL